jgi:hypothetical protein
MDTTPMTLGQFEQLVRRILATQGDEIDCQQVADLIAHYVELEVAGRRAPDLLPQVYQHLVQCDACGEIRDVLYELVALEAEGALPNSEDLLDDVVTPAEPRREAPATSLRVAGPTPKTPKRMERYAAGRPATVHGQRVPAADGRVRWTRWVAVVLLVVVVVVVGLWLMRNGGPISQLNESLALAAIVYSGSHPPRDWPNQKLRH